MDQKLVAVLMLLPALLPAQTGGVTGPVLGYIAESATGGLRPVLGIPGASIAGDPLALDFPVTLAARPARQDYILAVAQTDGAVRCILPDRGTAVAVEGASAGPDEIVIAAGGRAAGLYHHESGALQIVTGLPAAPVVSRTADLSTLPARPAALALSDDGATVVAAVGASLYLMTSGQSRPVPVAGEAAAMAFLNDGRDLVFADRAASQVWLLSDLAATPAPRLLAGPGEGIARPLAVAVANGRVIVANGEGSTIVAIDLATSAISSVACSCTPVALEPWNGRALFRVSAEADRPLWLYDAGGPDPQLWFVPVSTEVRP